jgi:hypothetical protein
MLARANNYMTLAHVKLDSFVICLSYKGKSERNLEDLHDFVFRMPTLEYVNKTWSNLDLALRLKKDVIRALISHTGAIIGNKFSHHRPTKKTQERLREMANLSTLIPNSDNIRNDQNYTTSESASLYSYSQGDTEDSPRMSFNTDRNGGGHHISHGTSSTANGSSVFDVPPSTSLLRTGSWSNNGSNLPSGITTPNGGGSSAAASGVSSPVPPAMRAGRGHREDSMATIRPHTASGAPSIGKSLLKDTLGKHFGNATGSVKGRVRFGPLSGSGAGLMSDARDGSVGGDARGRGESMSASSVRSADGGAKERRGSGSIAPDEDDDESKEKERVMSDGDAEETGSTTSRKKSVLLLGRKVLGRLS